eukprot:10319406-Ditylum_brightwellii.AAC.1
MTAHLEAHGGGRHYMNRNCNLAEILSRARVGPGHSIFCGDLNYCVVLSSTDQIEQEGRKHII